MKTVTGTWSYPNNAPVANGRVFLRLSQDAVVAATTQIAPALISFTLNSNGQIPGGSQLWASDELTPQAQYVVSVLDANNALVYGAEIFSITGASPINLNTLTPTSSGISFPNPVLQNPTAAQTITGFDLNLSSANLNVSSGNRLEWNSDTGLSRDSAGVIDIGNGTQGSVSGSLKLANITTQTIQNYANTSFSISDANGVSHFFISNTAPYNNTFISGSGGSVIIGSSGGVVVSDSSGKITTYNGIATTGNGVVSLPQSVDLTGQTAAIGTTTLYAVPASGAGQYRVSWNAKVTNTAGVSSTLGALTIVYTDPDGIAQTIVATGQTRTSAIAATETTNTTAAVLLGMPLLLNCKASTNITYAMAYASNAANVMAYNLHIKLESL